jgi:6-phosphogluconate dehydrogenase
LPDLESSLQINMAQNHSLPVKRIGIVGAGNMGSMMTLGFAEQGVDVSLWDVAESNVDQAREMAKQAQEQEKSLKGKIDFYKDIHEFTGSLKDEKPAVYVFSITHGNPADQVLQKIKDDLRDGDIILDGGNENYRNTERRQKELESKRVHWVGMGVSGGYQSARRGPSMSPGGEREAVQKVLPLLEKFAAKDPKSGKPCVTYIGPRGAGHYVRGFRPSTWHVANPLSRSKWSTMASKWACSPP